MYLIDGRGQKCLRDLSPSLFERLVASAVAMADAKIGVLTPKGLTERVNPIKVGGVKDVKGSVKKNTYEFCNPNLKSMYTIVILYM